MRKFYVIAGILVLVIVLAVTGCGFALGSPNQPSYPYGPGNGRGFGMMGGGMGPGMMGGSWGNYIPNPDAKPISIDQAASAVETYLNGYGAKLELTEIMNFAWNYYAEVEENDTGIHAMELLIDKYSGQVYPEQGPNMMWNTKYSHMSGMMGNYWRGTPNTDMPVSAEQARANAQQYLDANLPGVTVEEADTFYGYYTLHTLKNGSIEGMLSVNGYTGAVWYHSWHGSFIEMKEFE